MDSFLWDRVEQVIKEEISNGNYVVVQERPVIVSALGTIPKPDSSKVRKSAKRDRIQYSV